MAARVAIRVTPRAGRDVVEGWSVDAEGRPVLLLKVTAPPADGAANRAVLKLLAKSLGAPKSALRLLSGETSRHKRVEIDLTPETVAERLGAPPD
ncbi:MAG: DUF167 domain-containing protein [Rhodobacteraceae bacterium]|nr:DUF167 domain-containing protein [Paracoccaceae bacterium]